MIYAAIILLAVSAILGLTILIKWLTNKNASSAVIYSHGIVAAAAIVILVVYAVQHPDNFPKISIALLALAAIGGFYMFIRDLNKKQSPMAVAFIHALLAVAGVVALLVFTFA
jgi:drug/metabolite transporter superfamily protein YnfA